MCPGVSILTAAIILAAGASTRFGSPKQLAIYQGERLLERAVRTASEAGCSPIIVVLGAHASEIQRSCDLDGVRVCLNDGWAEGMASSVRLGIAALGGAEAALVMTCDMPAITPAHLQRLMASGALTASRYDNCNGVPAFFPAASFAELLSLQRDEGARALLRSGASVELRGGELDIDTPADLQLSTAHA